MYNDEFVINKIIQGGIYFVDTSYDNKRSPYIVVSRDNGFGMNVLCMRITSKYDVKNHILPIVMNDKVSFIKTSSLKEIYPRELVSGTFEGVVRSDILTMAIELYINRIININDETLNERIEKYVDTISKMNLSLRDDPSIIFNKNILLNYDKNPHESVTIEKPKLEFSPTQSVFIDSKKSMYNNQYGYLDKISMKSNIHNDSENDEKYRRYPFDLNDWTDDDIFEFVTDQKKLSEKEMMKKYNANRKRLNYLKKNVKFEYIKRGKK